MEGSCFSLSALERRIGAIFFYWDVYNMFLQVSHLAPELLSIAGHETTGMAMLGPAQLHKANSPPVALLHHFTLLHHSTSKRGQPKKYATKH